MKIFKQKYKIPSKKEFPPIITYHDKRYGGTKVDEQGRFYTVEDETQRLFRWERMIRKKERTQEQIKTWIAIKEGNYHKKNYYMSDRIIPVNNIFTGIKCRNLKLVVNYLEN